MNSTENLVVILLFSVFAALKTDKPMAVFISAVSIVPNSCAVISYRRRSSAYARFFRSRTVCSAALSVIAACAAIGIVAV